ncbi:unnamed protein product [Rhodiola kirilowii]
MCPVLNAPNLQDDQLICLETVKEVDKGR